jgi:hypothetical protein
LNLSGYCMCYTFQHVGILHSGHRWYLRVFYMDLKATEMISLHNIKQFVLQRKWSVYRGVGTDILVSITFHVFL